MPPDSFAAVVRVRRFMAFACGQTVSQFGDKLDQMALVAMLGTLSTGPRAAWSLAGLAVVIALPVILLGPLAGVLVDRWDRRTTLVTGDVIRGILVALIPGAHRVAGALWPVYVIVFLVFLVTLVSNAAKMAVIPNLVARRQLLAANALATFLGRVATIAGIVLGGLVIDWGIWSRFGWRGYEPAFYLDGVSFAFSALMLGVAIPRRQPVRVDASVEPAGEASLAPGIRGVLGRVVSDFGEAIRLVRSDRRLGFIFGTIALMAAAAGAAYVLVAVDVQTVRRFGTSGLGIIGGIGAGGMVLGSFLAGTVIRRWPRHRTILSGSLAIGALALAYTQTATFGGASIVAFLIGTCFAPIVITQDTWLHELLPERTRGRGFAIRELLNNAVGALASVAAAAGVFVWSALGAANPYRLSLFVLGGALIAVTIATRLASPWREPAPPRRVAVPPATTGALGGDVGAVWAAGGRNAPGEPRGKSVVPSSDALL